MRFEPDVAEHVLETVLSACRVRVETVPDARCYESLREHGPGHFHLVGSEAHLLTGPTLQERTHLHDGDLIIFRSGTRHKIIVLPPAGGEPSASDSTSMLNGEFELPISSTSRLLPDLPLYLVVRAREATEDFRKLAHMLLAVARETRFGQRILIDKLACSLLAFAMCECAIRSETTLGAFAARDVRIARVLHAIHERFHEPWSVRSLASVAGMSRSTFALHFTTVVGMPPMQYVALQKVEQAKRLLKDRRTSVASVTEMLGYTSEAAFRKLFKRVEGVGPGSVRATARFNDRRAAPSEV